MKNSDALREFEEAGALQKGHFILSSGLHSDTYLNKSIVSMYPGADRTICAGRWRRRRATHRKARSIDYVVSPAMGAIIYGYETARHLGAPFMFVERVAGEFQLRRGFRMNERGAGFLWWKTLCRPVLSARECN